MRAAVLLSGGMDSCVALFHVLYHRQNYDTGRMDALFINYGQRAQLDLVSVERVLSKARHIYSVPLPLTIIDASKLFRSSASSVLSWGDQVNHYRDVEDAVNSTDRDRSYLPLRNSIFISLAAHFALSHAEEGENVGVVTGIRGRSDGPGGFPDCTAAFAAAMSQALTVSAGRLVTVIDPLNHLEEVSRVGTIQHAIGLPGALEALSYTRSCYTNDPEPCGKCLPCLRRRQAFEAAGLS